MEDREKIRTKSNISARGWSTAHNTPNIVCRYLTLRSLQAKKYSSSRCCHNSLRLRDIESGGLMMVRIFSNVGKDNS